MNNFINENEFILNDLQIYREFDISNFISNAKYSLSNKINNNRITPNIQKYSEMIQNVVNDVDILKIDSNSIINFFTTFVNTVFNNISDDIYINPLIKPDIYGFKPQYLSQYIENIELIIDRTIKNDIDKNDIDNLISNDITNKVKRQIVNTDLPYEYSAKKLIKINRSTNQVLLDDSYIKNTIIPFIKSSDSYRKSLIDEASLLIKIINDSNNKIQRFIIVLDKMKSNNELSTEIIQKLNYILYNVIRSFMDVTSFVSYAIIRKIDTFIQNTNDVIKLYNKLQSYSGNTTESTLCMVLTDDHSLADGLLTGHIDGYEELSNNTYNTIVASITNQTGLNNKSLDLEISNASYDKTQYEEANKMIITISQGLDIIAANSDDYLLVIDGIIEKSGFVLALDDRFRGTLSKLDDTTDYSSTNMVPTVSNIQAMLIKGLKEVNDYSENMKTLSNNIIDCKTKLLVLQQRFENNINDRYRNTEAINEIKNFLEDLTEQYNKLIRIIAGKFRQRLINLRTALNYMINSVKTPNVVSGEDTFNDNNVSVESVYDTLINDYEKTTDLIFESMSIGYSIAKQKKERGVNIVVEDTQNINNIGNNIVTQMSKWFDNIINKISGIINSKKDAMYFNKHKQELLNMNFNNVTSKVSIVNYESLQSYTVMNNDMRALASKINTANLSMAKIQTLKDNKALVGLIFGNNPPAYVWNEQNPTRAITNYYKYGKNRNINPTTFSGNNLKTIVTNAVNYCDSYNNKFLPELKKNITNIKNNLNVVSSTIVKESCIDDIIGSLFIEDANINDNDKTQQKNIDKLPNIDSKINFIKKYIQQYCTAVLNAANERYNDYMSLLHSLISDQKVK